MDPWVKRNRPTVREIQKLWHDLYSVWSTFHLTYFLCYKLISADNKKALICTTNSHVPRYSFTLKFFGDPDDYAYKLDNDTFADALPIHVDFVVSRNYDYYHSVTTDYNTQTMYFSNNYQQGLKSGLLVYFNSSTIYSYPAVPETNQVTVINIFTL